MDKLISKLNGKAPGITLLISMIATVGMGAGWVYQLRANSNEIAEIKMQYVRKDVSEAQYKALAEKIDNVNRSMCDLQRYLLESKNR